MPSVIELQDATEEVLTRDYSYGHFPFERFNPVQSRLMETFESENNIAIAASTSAGKTVCAEMYAGYEARKRGGKSIYVGPLKALASEKSRDWRKPSHHFSDLKTAICTGDFRMTSTRVNELNQSDLIVMTPEMLASRCRNHKSEKSKFLQDVGTIVFDESHLLTVPGRGDHMEVALMKMTEMNPDTRLVLLSATMPNVDEVCGWTSKLTGRDTFYLKSNYRPVPLNVWYETYFDGEKNYDSNEAQKVATACAICEYYPTDKFLIFVHTKRTGRLMVDTLARHGIKADFHNSELEYTEREKVEERFKGDSSYRVVVATSTLAWGLNMPARRVIVTGIHRGLDRVHNYDILQMIGRCGRFGLDPQGDAYILVPESTKKESIASLKKPEIIRSTLLDFVGKAENPHYKTLAFHVVSEIHQGTVKSKEEFHQWMNRSFAFYQGMNSGYTEIDKTIDLLQSYRAITQNEEKELECTGIGKVASMFYYSPFDVSCLKRNFSNIFERNLGEEDYAVSMGLGNIDSYMWGIVNREERGAMALYQKKVEELYGQNFQPSAIKMGFAYFNMLRGKRNVDGFQSTMGMLFADMGRIMQVLTALDDFSARWGKADYFRKLRLRLLYGAEADIVELVQIPKVGATRARRLKTAGIATLDDFLSKDAAALAKIMNVSVKLANEAIEGAKQAKAGEMVK